VFDSELSEAISFTLLDNCSFIVRYFFKLSNRASTLKNNINVSNVRVQGFCYFFCHSE